MRYLTVEDFERSSIMTGYKPDLLAEIKLVEKYFIVGNQFVAIAINREDPRDSHWFTRVPEVDDNAFIAACGWAYEPE